MRKVTVKELTVENFKAYGSFANLVNPEGPVVGAVPCEFFRDMCLLNLGQAQEASFSVCRVSKRPLIVDGSEIHHCGEGMLPLDGDVLMHVAIATPENKLPVDKVEVFRVPKGTFVAIRPGVWHGGAFAFNQECVNAMIVLPERAYANDCFVYNVPEKDRVEIDYAG